jgi:hypothetical protein
MSIYDTHKPAAGAGGLYLKLEDGEKAKVRIYSDPAIFESESNFGGEKKLSTRYGWVVWNRELGVPQIWQGSATFFKQLATLAQDSDWGDPAGYDVTISRQGTGTDTVYSIVPTSNRDPLDIEAVDALKKVNLIEKLQASEFNQRVMWLSEYDDLATRPKESNSIAGTNANDKKNAAVNVTTEHLEDEPINLDDIPF